MDSLFFFAARLFWLLARPETWLLLPLLLAARALARGRLRRGTIWLWSGMGLLLAFGLLPLGELLLRPLEARFPVRPTLTAPAGIILLGGAEDARRSGVSGLAEVNDAAERFMAAVALAREYPDARLVFTGGSGALFGAVPSSAAVAARIFAEAGIPDARVLLEGEARNTAENARLTRELLGPETTGPWLLVTSAFHMPRAMGAFCAAGWRGVVPYPVDFRGGGELGWDLGERLRTLNLAVKEWVGLLAYRLTGRSARLLPSTCSEDTPRR